MNLHESRQDCAECVGHTPTPWRIHSINKTLVIESKYLHTIVATTGYDPIANAAHIVRCVNSHDALVKALEVALDRWGRFECDCGLPGCVDNKVRAQIDAALKAYKDTL